MKLDMKRCARRDRDDDDGERQRQGASERWRRPDGALPVDGRMEFTWMVSKH